MKQVPYDHARWALRRKLKEAPANPAPRTTIGKTLMVCTNNTPTTQIITSRIPVGRSLEATLTAFRAVVAMKRTENRALSTSR